ncbi:MAG: RHS repeat-associated core domain-containing protein [Holophaga sp.]|nr:RHS repeat-associated core domain-containing protein [Holophaga sp.]
MTIRTTSSEGKTRFSRLFLAQPSPGGEYGAAAWPLRGKASQSLSSQKQMMLFALGTVVREESGYDNGAEIITQRTSMEGWSLLNRANPNGVVEGEVGLKPTPTRVRTEYPQDLGPTMVRELTGWDALTNTYTNSKETTLPPDQGASAQDASALAWRGESIGASSQVTGFIERTGNSQATWNSTLLRAQINTSSSSVAGSDYVNERGVPSVDLGTKTYGYDTKGRTTSVSGVSGGITGTTTNTYGTGPEVTDVSRSMTGTEPAGEVGEAYSWNGPFRTGVRIKPDPRWSTEDRDSLGRLTRMVSPEGVTTRTQYDSLGRVTVSSRDAVAGAGAIQTQTEYAPDGRTLLQTVSGSGIATRKTRTKLDGAGRPIAVTVDADTSIARTVFTTYDGFGNKVFESLPLRKASLEPGDPRTTYEYEADGFLKSVTNARGFITTYSRPTRGNLDGVDGFLSTASNTKGTTTSLKDLMGQVRRVKDVTGVIARLSYDAYGHLTRVERAGQVRKYTYNAVGWLLDQEQPEEGITTYGRHTFSGTPLRASKGGGTVNTYVHTSGSDVGLPSSVSTSGAGTSVDRSYAYTNRRLTSMSETQNGSSVWESYGYDSLGRNISKFTSDGSQGFTVSRNLDAAGNVIDLHYPQGAGKGDRISRNSLDEFGRAYSMAFGSPSGPGGIATMKYDAWGQDQDLLMYANDTFTFFGRNAFQELSRVIHYQTGWNAVEDAWLTWSADGLLTDRGSDHFEYDALGRLNLSRVSGPDGSRVQQNFAYDVWGNRTSTVSTALAGGLPEEAANYAMSYGSDNRIPNFTAAGANTGAIYDGLGRLTQVNAIPGQENSRTSWTYDGMGRVIAQGGARAEYSESYLLDGSGLRFRRNKADGSREYVVYGFNREPLSRFLAPAAGGLLWKGDMVYAFGQLVMEDKPSGRTYQQADQVGTPTILTDASGVVTGRQKALPFGERMSGVVGMSARRYTNHEDGPQFPIYMQARMYLPTYGRFAAPDPAYDHSSDGLNLYSYCSNNPVTRTDPDGMRDISAGGSGHPGSTQYLHEPISNWMDEDESYDPWIVAGMAGGGGSVFNLFSPIERPVYSETTAASSKTAQGVAGKVSRKSSPSQPIRLVNLGNNIIFVLLGIENEEQVLNAVRIALQSPIVQEAHRRGQAKQKRPLYVRATRNAGKFNAALYDPWDNSININPNGTFYLPTEKGPTPTSLDVIFAHEMGHQDGTIDGPSVAMMENVNGIENQYRVWLGIPLRTSYLGGFFTPTQSATVIVVE